MVAGLGDVMSWELAKAIFDWTAVVLVGLTFMVGAGALISGNVLNKRQAAKLRQFEMDLEKQRERAANAEAALFELQKAQLQRTLSAQTITFLQNQPPGTAHVEILYKRDDPEAADFAESIWGLLASCHWSASRPTPIPQRIHADRVLEILGAATVGVTIVQPEFLEKADPSSSVVMAALAKSLPWGRINRSRSPSKLPENTIRIIVMAKE